MSYETMTLISSILLMLCGMSALFRHHLLEPKMTAYPKAPRWLLLIFFGFGTGCLWLGIKMFLGHFCGETPIQSRFFVLVVLIFVLKTGLLINTVRQRLPEIQREKLNRAEEAAMLLRDTQWRN